MDKATAASMNTTIISHHPVEADASRFLNGLDRCGSPEARTMGPPAAIEAIP
jgi:hypothetical protein